MSDPFATGTRYERLVVLGASPSPSKKHPKVLVRCDCGTEKSIFRQGLIAGLVLSCGCLGRERRAARTRTHGQGGRNRTGTYTSWAGMMDRCEWGGHHSYETHYGAKGIRVCERWHSFENFLADMGPRPSGHSIDRIDGTKGYSPDNCRWASRTAQNLNTSRVIKVSYCGEIIQVPLLCDRLGLSRKAVRGRASRRGNDYVEALRSLGIECEKP